MPLPLREILDSEDEDELVPVKAPSPVATFGSGEDASIDMDVDPSTASTAEQLRRAHLALMAPTQDESLAIDPANNKRPLADTDYEPRSSGKLKRIKIITKSSPQGASTAATVPGPTIPESVPPFDGTSDTVPGDTYPALSVQDGTKQTPNPRTRTRTSSQQRSSSGDQQSTLTPWSASAVDSSGHLNSEDVAIGLPKELYKPRPSRSRSAQIRTTHYDYSLVPEKAAKKAKRTKTDTKDPSSSAPIFPDNPILRSPTFERFTPPPGSVINETAPQAPIETDKSAELAPQEQPPSSKPSKGSKKATKPRQPGKRGRPKKQPAVEEEDELALDSEISVAKPQTPKSASKTEVQVVIPTTSKPADQDMLNNILAGLGHNSSKEPTPQSPPKTDSAAAKLESDDSDSLEPAGKTGSVDMENRPGHESEGMLDTPKPGISKTVSGPGIVAKTTPQTAKKSAKGSPPKPSWQRTPYRVGLSKTQRIPSLLKVLKK